MRAQMSAAVLAGLAVCLLGGCRSAGQAQLPLWVWELWDRSPSTNVPVEPLSDPEAREHHRRLLVLFETSKVRGSELTESDRWIFSTIRDSQIDIRFSAAEQELIRDFLTK